MHDVSVIVVMCGDIQYFVETRSWGLATHDAYGITFDQWVVAAAAALFRRLRPSPMLLVSGGKSNAVAGSESRPSIAEVYAAELELLGVPSEHIHQERLAFNSLQQLQLCARLLRESSFARFPWILATKCHIPRIDAMRRYWFGCDLAPLDNAGFFAVEDALMEDDSTKWDPIIAAVKSIPEMAARVALELQGTAQVILGTYRWRPVET